MKTYLCAFAMCQSMFCAIPFPGRLWDEKARGKMLLFLPVVGLEIGLVWAALAWAVRFLKLPALVGGLALCACPFLLTGFIHLDGFMDVTDAVKSWRDLEKRRAILKDSHVGSFAVIGLCLLMLSQFAFFSAASEGADFRILLFIPAVSPVLLGAGGDGASPHVLQPVRRAGKAQGAAVDSVRNAGRVSGGGIFHLRKVRFCAGGVPCRVRSGAAPGVQISGRHER